MKTIAAFTILIVVIMINFSCKKEKVEIPSISRIDSTVITMDSINMLDSLTGVYSVTEYIWQLFDMYDTSYFSAEVKKISKNQLSVKYLDEDRYYKKPECLNVNLKYKYFLNASSDEYNKIFDLNHFVFNISRDDGCRDIYKAIYDFHR